MAVLKAQSSGDIGYFVPYSPVTITATLETVVEGTFERDSTGKEIKSLSTFNVSWVATDKKGNTTNYSSEAAKTRTLKYGNKEFLKDLYDAGILQGDPKHYVIYAYATTSPSSSGIHFDGFWASPKISGLEGIDLTPYLNTTEVGPVSYNLSKNDSSNNSGEIYSRKYSGKYNYKGVVFPEFQIPGNFSFVCSGLFAGSATDTYWNPTPSMPSNELSVIAAPGACSISGLIGESIVNGYRVVLTGSIKIGGSKAYKFTFN